MSTLEEAQQSFGHLLESSLVVKGDFVEDKIKELSQDIPIAELMPALLRVFNEKISVQPQQLTGNPEQASQYLRQILRVFEEGTAGYLCFHVDRSIVRARFQTLLNHLEQFKVHPGYIPHINMHLEKIKERL